MVKLGSSAQRELYDVALARYDCHLLAQNGAVFKLEIKLILPFKLESRKLY
ncbi:MAG: hypothetical protein LBQ31_11015 [Bacteroidales bacterium]|jgi:hypothetical protein|nr:hypothetical protein [Bacteroidales bacterium]